MHNPHRDYWDKFSETQIYSYEHCTKVNSILMYKQVDLTKPCKIIEVGCASGMSLSYLLENTNSNSTIDAIDFSGEMVYECKSKQSLDRLTIKQMDACLLMQEDDSFDYYFSNLTLLNVSDFDTALSEAYRVLKHDGMLCFSAWTDQTSGRSSFTTMHVEIFWHFVRQNDVHIEGLQPTNYNDDDIENTIALLMNHGFKIKDYVIGFVEIENDDVDRLIELILETKGEQYESVLKDKYQAFKGLLRTAQEKILEKGESVGFETINQFCICDKN